ncbi:site-specific integrase [Klebsiella quasipneumoniae]|uniref:site-specific integrase n=1 Tax=Klebsiella quasipneumoniae TaxID=1463165 RepID=UPI00136621E1|nr:site-specific integrase [Klebsiella quasipneumoniae]NBZ45948.1 site-specific integrase [Klebsiella quasipneumoniae]
MPVHYLNAGDMFVEATPVFSISNDGELLTSWKQNGIHLKNMYLLFDSQDRPINAANEYLIHCKAVDRHQDLSCIAKGLTLFFTFLEREQLCWSDMPRASHMRPLYRFRDYLQTLHDEIDPQSGKRRLASSTAKSYRGAAVGMYIFWMGYGDVFLRPPCQFSEVNISDKRILGHINRYIKVQTTDLKITARDKVKQFRTPNHLRPLLKEQRPELQSLLGVLNEGRSYTRKKDKYIAKTISPEIRIAVYLSLYTGMRRIEVLTFSSTLIQQPSLDEKTITVMIGPGNHCHTKRGESGEIKIPVWLMRQLYAYKQSARYRKRLSKYLQLTPDSLASKYPPLLLNNQGYPYNENSLNARWGEICNAIRIDYNLPTFSHKFHNLRSTYATYLTIALLQLTHPSDHPRNPNEPVLTRDQVEAEVQARLRHSSPQTTALYVKFWEDNYLERQSDRIHQEGLDRIYGDDNTIGVWGSLHTDHEG